MANVMTTMTVPDFQQWKTGFDAGVAPRQAAGWQGTIIYRGEQNPNEVTLIHEWKSTELFKAFVNNPVLLEIQKKIGITDSKYFILTAVNS